MPFFLERLRAKPQGRPILQSLVIPRELQEPDAHLIRRLFTPVYFDGWLAWVPGIILRVVEVRETISILLPLGISIAFANSYVLCQLKSQSSILIRVHRAPSGRTASSRKSLPSQCMWGMTESR